MQALKHIKRANKIQRVGKNKAVTHQEGSRKGAKRGAGREGKTWEKPGGEYWARKGCHVAKDAKKRLRNEKQDAKWMPETRVKKAGNEQEWDLKELGKRRGTNGNISKAP